MRPISSVDGYPDTHWVEVHHILAEACTEAGYTARLVSDDDSIGVILGRIVSNLYDDPITIVDVSSLNPNVMFELGMRLAFDKPVVVIKDNITRYPFDASPLEYLQYPSDLRHGPLMAFKDQLVQAVGQTAAAPSRPGYRSFLKHFGSLKAGELGEGQSLETRIVLEELQSIKALMRRASAEAGQPSPINALAGSGKSHSSWWTANSVRSSEIATLMHTSQVPSDNIETYLDEVRMLPGVVSATVSAVGAESSRVLVSFDTTFSPRELSIEMERLGAKYR